MRLSLSGLNRARRASGGTLVGTLQGFGDVASRRPIGATCIVLGGGVVLGHGYGDAWVWIVGCLFAIGLGVRSVLCDPRSERPVRRGRRVELHSGNGPAGVPNDIEAVN